MTGIKIVHADRELAAALGRRRRQWRQLDGTRRLWSGDAGLWTGSGEEEGLLGWLDVERLGRVGLLEPGGGAVEVAAERLGDRLAGPSFHRCLLLGMGGSALGAELLWRALPKRSGAEFIVLDTTDPREIAAALDGFDPAAARVIAASKSGGTIETRLAFELLLDRLGDAAPAAALAVTDPGSALERRARAAGVGAAFGHPDIGGRFSVLSAFGLAPAAVAGIDPAPLLASARTMAAACRRNVREEAANPGVELGLLLAAAHDCGRDKLHLHAPRGLRPMTAWVEQLVAESLGKAGVLLLPVAAAAVSGHEGTGACAAEHPAEGSAASAEHEGASAAARADRIDIVLGRGRGTTKSPLASAAIPDRAPAAWIEAVLPAELGGELFRWQFGVAVAGALLGINPFDQPDVESSKVVTRRYVERIKAGAAPALPKSVVRLSEVSALGLAQLVGVHAATLPDRGYAVVSAYLDRGAANRELLSTLRRRLARLTGSATVLGFGPSFLHSTGQAHKGGPNRGLFLQITADPPAADIEVPGEGLTFGQVQLAQAWGDVEVLVERRRRVLAIHLDGAVEPGLRRLIDAVS